MPGTFNAEDWALDPVEAGPYIGGAFVESDGAGRYASISPATGEEVGGFALGAPTDVDRAVAAAREAFGPWSRLSVFERAEYLEAAMRIIASRREHLARVMTLEQGKPYYGEALREVDDSITNFRVTIDLAKYRTQEILPSAEANMRAYLYRVPKGVVAAIQPWNFPLGSAAGQIAPALITGNTVVALAAPSTTLIEYEWFRCFHDAGIPAGVINFLTGLGADIGDAMTGHEGVQVVAFTGSVATGRRVMRSAAGKATLIELGGNGPTVILDDADLDRAVPDSVASVCGAAGQSCTAAGRFLVHERIYDEFAERLAAEMRERIRVGHPFDPETTMGPVNNSALADRLDAHLRDAKAAGARVLLDGGRAEGFPTDLYFTPVVLADVDESMTVTVEETFGPIAPLQRISSDEEALRLLDESPFGLFAAVYSRDLGRALRFAERASAGAVNINRPSGSVETHWPVGGHAGKLSGHGRIQGAQLMDEIYTETKLVLMPLD